MKQLDDIDIGVNIVACLCLAENAISSTSYKPSDICRGYTGKTVEIIHTDAEGRLVLADGVSYISKNYTPKHMITIATLT
jgi:leucyl aminopeptidase